jgi:hypothetical protein
MRHLDYKKGREAKRGRPPEWAPTALCDDRRTSEMRTWTCIVALCAALLTAHSAIAASTAARICAADIKAQCGDVMRSGGLALKDCMKTHFSNLSEDCQVAIIRAAAVGKACRADAKRLCADIKPGRGTVPACMKSHAADLSGACKEAIAKAQAGDK